MKIVGYAPSYVFESGIGKRIAKLKGLERGWQYPTYLFGHIRNPAALLLFDEIVIDKEAAEKTIEYATLSRNKHREYEGRVVERIRPSDSEILMLEHLIGSNLFKKENIEQIIEAGDFNRIKRGYRNDLESNEFQERVDLMRRTYGVNYAQPDPLRFEAMNMNVTWTLLDKLSAKPLDDVMRSPLYEFKISQESSLAISEVKTASELLASARHVLFLPSEPLRDVDRFLGLHKDNKVLSFRKKVSELSKSKASSQEIRREVQTAQLQLEQLKPNRWSIVVAIASVVGTIIEWEGGTFSTQTIINSFPAALSLAEQIRKHQKRVTFGWLQLLKGLCEV